MYRKGVSALIANSKNEFLLVNLMSFEEKYFAIPGGGVEVGETLEEAAYREIKEELGIETSLLEQVGRSSHPLQVTFKTPKNILAQKDIFSLFVSKAMILKLSLPKMKFVLMSGFHFRP